MKQSFGVGMDQSEVEKHIVEYLLQHSDFIDRHSVLLEELKLSHESGQAVSLIERQVEVLRDKNKRLKSQLDEFIQIARDNDLRNERVQRFTLNLVAAESLDEVFLALQDSLIQDFGADVINVRLFVNVADVQLGTIPEHVDLVFMDFDDPGLQQFKSALDTGEPVCGVLPDDQLNYLYGDKAAEVASTALVTLGGRKCKNEGCSYIGVLAVGSHDPDRFSPEMGTLFLNYFAELLSRAIQRFV